MMDGYDKCRKTVPGETTMEKEGRYKVNRKINSTFVVPFKYREKELSRRNTACGGQPILVG